MTAGRTDDPWLTVEQAAQHMQVSQDYIYRRTAEGTLKHVKRGRMLRLRRSDLDAFLESPPQAGVNWDAVAAQTSAYLYLLRPDGEIVVGNRPPPGETDASMPGRAATEFVRPACRANLQKAIEHAHLHGRATVRVFGSLVEAWHSLELTPGPEMDGKPTVAVVAALAEETVTETRATEDQTYAA